jgi:hypothetical protein
MVGVGQWQRQPRPPAPGDYPDGGGPEPVADSPADQRDRCRRRTRWTVRCSRSRLGRLRTIADNRGREKEQLARTPSPHDCIDSEDGDPGAAPQAMGAPKRFW